MLSLAAGHGGLSRATVHASAPPAFTFGAVREQLSIAFGAIVRNAEHLAVLSRGSAALAPCFDVVRVHFGELP